MSGMASSLGRVGSAIRRVGVRPEVRQATVLASGSVIAQALAIATTPILARIYGPTEFGGLATLLALSTIGGSIGALCYETAIMLPRSRRMAVSLFVLSLLLSGIVSGIVILALAFGVPAQFAIEHGVVFLTACYLSTALTTLFNALGYVHSRAAQFRPVAVSKINQSWLSAVFQIVLGVTTLHPVGLIVGRTAGMAATVAWLFRDLPHGFRLADLSSFQPRALPVAAYAYRDFILNVPRQLLVRGASSLPPILLLTSYGAAAAGLFFFGVRLVERPGALLGDALSRVPMRHFAELRMQSKPLTRAALLYTAALVPPIVLGVALLVAVARPLFALAFGETWVAAADYAVVLAAWAAVRLISLPMTTLIAVLRIQAISLAIDAVFFARIFVIPVMAAHGDSALAAVGAFCAISIVYHVILFLLGLWAAWRYDRSLPAGAKMETPSDV